MSDLPPECFNYDEQGAVAFLDELQASIGSRMDAMGQPELLRQLQAAIDDCEDHLSWLGEEPMTDEFEATVVRVEESRMAIRRVNARITGILRSFDTPAWKHWSEQAVALSDGVSN